MANCLQPDCSFPAIAGSDFCGSHQPGGRTVIYARDETDFELEVPFLLRRRRGGDAPTAQEGAEGGAAPTGNQSEEA